MKSLKLFFLTSLLVSAFQVGAAENHIFCGDINKYYAEMDMGDLSSSFRAKYYSDESIKTYKKQGYDYAVAGRNCGLNNYLGSPEYDVLILFKGKNHVKETIDLGPFSIFHAKIFLNEIDVAELDTDLVLTGDSKRDLVSTESRISGRIDVGRGAGKLKLIISRK